MFSTRRSEGLSRREWLKLASAGVVGFSFSGWLEALANTPVEPKKRNKSCILLWMNGGPSQMDTFDLKPGHANGGPFKAIDTSVPGIQISEHLPKIAKFMDKMALIRTMATGKGQNVDHGQETYHLHTGYQPRGPIQYPTFGSLVAKENGTDDAALPNFVSIAPYRLFNPGAFNSGFLGPKYAPLIVGEVQNIGQPQMPGDYDKALKVQDLAPPADAAGERFDARVGLLQDLQRDFTNQRPGLASKSHQTAYERAVRLMRTSAQKAFNLEEEPDSVRDAYGRNLFGQGCLLARRLVEQHVPFVEVTLGGFAGNQLGWDTHGNNFEAVQRLCNILDPAWSQLLEDLKARGLLESTLLVWAGEFGRTPKINPQRGRDHWGESWSTVLAGGGIKGGQVIGKTNEAGDAVTERPVKVPDFLATISKALDIDPMTQNMSNVGRPIRIADPSAKPLAEVLG